MNGDLPSLEAQSTQLALTCWEAYLKFPLKAVPYNVCFNCRGRGREPRDELLIFLGNKVRAGYWQS